MVSIGASSLNWCADLLDCGSGRQKWCLLGLVVQPSSRWSLKSRWDPVTQLFVPWVSVSS